MALDGPMAVDTDSKALLETSLGSGHGEVRRRRKHPPCEKREQQSNLVTTWPQLSPWPLVRWPESLRLQLCDPWGWPDNVLETWTKGKPETVAEAFGFSDPRP